MKSKILWLILSCLLTLSLLLASCGTKTTPITTQTATTATTKATTLSTTKPTTTSTIVQPTVAMTPQYGGTFTYRVNADANNIDPYFYPQSGTGGAIIKLWLETLAMPDFNAIYQKKYHFKSNLKECSGKIKHL
jgi:ABC-type transport system substrate-binding protein